MNWVGAVAMLVIGLMSGCTTQHLGTDRYQPLSAQGGKDVMWMPTPNSVVTEMLTVAQVTSTDVVYDLGAGDGKIPIEAARRFGARAVGIEFNSDLAALARRNAQLAGVDDRVTIVTGDIFKEDFSHATVVTLYLLTQLNIKLKPALLAMKPGTRVVSNTFAMGAWEPDAIVRVEGEAAGYFWVVPAQVQGSWTFTGLPGFATAHLNLSQKSQKFDGDLMIHRTLSQRIEGRLRGAEISFDFHDGDGQLLTFKGIVSANNIHGIIQQISGSSVTASRTQ